MGVRIANLQQAGRPKKEIEEIFPISLQAAADKLLVDRIAARKVLEQGTPELIKAVERGAGVCRACAPEPPWSTSAGRVPRRYETRRLQPTTPVRGPFEGASGRAAVRVAQGVLKSSSTGRPRTGSLGHACRKIAEKRVDQR